MIPRKNPFILQKDLPDSPIAHEQGVLSRLPAREGHPLAATPRPLVVGRPGQAS